MNKSIYGRACPLCFVVLGLMVLGACTPQQVNEARCAGRLDNPEQHFVEAMQGLERGDTNAAERALEPPLACNEPYAPAHAAQALLYAMRADSHADAAYRQADAERARAALRQAEKHSTTPETRFTYHTTAIRVSTHLQGEDWLAQAERHFQRSQALKVDEKLLPYYRGREAAIYFMGVAFFQGAHDAGRARDLFRQVLDAKREGPGMNRPTQPGVKRTRSPAPSRASPSATRAARSPSSLG